MKLAMAVGTNNYHRIDQIHGRHFLQSAEKAGLPKALIRNALAELVEAATKAIENIENELPKDFPAAIDDTVRDAINDRVRSLRV